MTIGKTAVTRTVWLVVAALSFGLLAAASPLRYQMLLDDAYGYGASLSEIGLSLRFFAIYFTFFEHDFCTLKTNTPNSKKNAHPVNLCPGCDNKPVSPACHQLAGQHQNQD